jgi:hypothetical protein
MPRCQPFLERIIDGSQLHITTWSEKGQQLLQQLVWTKIKAPFAYNREIIADTCEQSQIKQKIVNL